MEHEQLFLFTAPITGIWYGIDILLKLQSFYLLQFKEFSCTCWFYRQRQGKKICIGKSLSRLRYNKSPIWDYNQDRFQESGEGIDKVLIRHSCWNSTSSRLIHSWFGIRRVFTKTKPVQRLSSENSDKYYFGNRFPFDNCFSFSDCTFQWDLTAH